MLKQKEILKIRKRNNGSKICSVFLKPLKDNNNLRPIRSITAHMGQSKSVKSPKGTYNGRNTTSH